MLLSRTSGIAVVAVAVVASIVGAEASSTLGSRGVAAQLVAGRTVALVGASAVDPAAGQAAAQKAEAASLPRMTPRQLAGQRVIYSYPGPTPPASLLSLVRNGDAAGVIFFSNNYRTRRQFTHAVNELIAANASRSNPARAYPLLLMTDQEGGLVRRLPGAPTLSERKIGAMRPLSAAEAAARQAGSGAATNLRSYHLNVNLAPVLDVFRTAGDFDDKYQRSYSMRPGVVSTLGAQFITAQQAGKVAATAKHFPGLGAARTSQNTDKVPVTLRLSVATIKNVDEYPYHAAIKAGVKLIMVSWAKYPSLDARHPAGLSSKIVQGQLRTRLGYDGVTITDAIGAGALTSFGSISNRSLLAGEAGMDLILAASQRSSEGVLSVNGLESGYKSGKLPTAAFRAAVARILALRHSLPS